MTLDTASIRARWSGPEHSNEMIHTLCDEVDRLRKQVEVEREELVQDLRRDKLAPSPVLGDPW